jgi:hypothetical protein
MMKRLHISLLLLFLTAPAGALAQIDPDKNPRKIHSQTGFDDIGDPISAIFKWLIIFLPTVTALYLIISGYRYIIAQGNQELVEKAKKSLLYAVYGFVIACISVALIVLVSRALGFDVGL